MSESLLEITMRVNIWAAGLPLSFVAVGVGVVAPFLVLLSEDVFCRSPDFCTTLFVSPDDEPAREQAPELIRALNLAAFTGSTTSMMQRV
jgi:hypothetical protein